MNNSRNLLGRITALALILGAAYGVHRLAGGAACPLMGACCVPGAKTEAVAPAADQKAAPAAPAKVKAEPAPAPKNGGDEE